MKRISSLCLILALLISANSAFASRAREQVMGTADPLGVLSSGQHGSFYYDDNYNIFFNPSYANEWKNWVAVEKDNGTGTAGQAEGGFVASMMNFSVGAFFNRGDAIQGTYGVGNSSGTNMRPIDLIVAGDMGVKWGLGLTYGNFKPAPDQNASELSARFGVQVADFEPFVNVLIIGKDPATATAAERKNKNFSAGLKYHWGEWAPYAAVKTGGTWGLGIGRNTKFAENASFNYSIGFWNGKTAAAIDTKRTIVPINVSVESELASWIIGRAGLVYNFIDRTSVAGAESTSTSPVSTTGRFGATFKLNKVDVDWAVGGATGGVDSTNFDFANGLFTTASMTYRW